MSYFFDSATIIGALTLAFTVWAHFSNQKYQKKEKLSNNTEQEQEE